MTIQINKNKDCKKISIFGSTGYVGAKTFDIAMQLGYEVCAITCNKNYKLAIEQALSANVQYIGVSCTQSYQIIKDYFQSNKNIQVLPQDNIIQIARIPTDICCMSIISPHAYIYTYEAIKHTKRLAIASKEAIIMLGNILISEARKYNVEIIPVDSEHNSLFQCLQNCNTRSIKGLTLTASGGPFRNFTKQQIQNVTVKDALQHPTWSMGRKITVDSATLINKAIEIVESSILFECNIDNIGAIIHPQSIVHCFIELENNSQLSCLYMPNMEIPIAHALTCPDIMPIATQSIDLAAIGILSFQDLNDWQRNSVKIATQAYKENKVIQFNVTNDFAVNKFLMGSIPFTGIWDIIDYVLNYCHQKNINKIEDIAYIIEETSVLCRRYRQ